MNDSELRQLLRHWRDIEPPGNFAANVHRRLRQSADGPPPAWWDRWLWRPSISLGAAVAVAILIGTTVGSRTMTRPDATGFLAADTLTGRYLKLTGGAHE